MKRPIFSVLTIAVVFSLAGCASVYVDLHRDQKAVANVWPNVACDGSVGVTRESGFMHFGAHGPWREKEFYGIYFKRGVGHPEEFYFTVHDGSETRIAESRGRVQVAEREVTIDVQYRGSSGIWVAPPINGRHKIDTLFPDDSQRSK